MCRNLVRVLDNSIQVVKDLAVCEERPVLGVETVKPVCNLRQLVNILDFHLIKHDIQNCPRLKTTICLPFPWTSILHPVCIHHQLVYISSPPRE